MMSNNNNIYMWDSFQLKQHLYVLHEHMFAMFVIYFPHTDSPFLNDNALYARFARMLWRGSGFPLRGNVFRLNTRILAKIAVCVR